MMDIKKNDDGAYEPTTLASFASCLHCQEKINKNAIHRPRLVRIGRNLSTARGRRPREVLKASAGE